MYILYCSRQVKRKIWFGDGAHLCRRLAKSEFHIHGYRHSPQPEKWDSESKPVDKLSVLHFKNPLTTNWTPQYASCAFWRVGRVAAFQGHRGETNDYLIYPPLRTPYSICHNAPCSAAIPSSEWSKAMWMFARPRNHHAITSVRPSSRHKRARR